MAAKIVFTAHTNLIQFSSFANYQRDGQKAFTCCHCHSHRPPLAKTDVTRAELVERQIDGGRGRSGVGVCNAKLFSFQI